MALEKIQKPNDIKKLSDAELAELPAEIRSFLVEHLSVTGGHLASNLGVVELTMALHLSFDLPKDKIIWDVGHQSYTHKILTGRKDRFDHLRQFKGMSGFPKRAESEYDCFDTGHSSTSISAGLGLAWAREFHGEDYHIVSVIGDGALTGGMAYEAMNNAAELEKNFIIVLNDNNMSISPNVGGMSEHLMKLRTSAKYTGLKENVQNQLEKIPGVGKGMVSGIRKAKNSIKQIMLSDMVFEDMGIMYLGPVDGHDVAAMRRAFTDAKNVQGPVLVHVLTKKGYGYEPAERHPSRFHGTAAFEIETGIPKDHGQVSYTDIFSTVMVKMGTRCDQVLAISAAMSDGTGLKRFRNKFPDRFFDVGIAEEHAVTFSAGLALGGMKPVFAVYSSFLQRGYDQIIHDVCLQHAPVVFAIDRAGIVGSDGDTHQGIFDISFLNCIPGMTIMAPKNLWEFSDMLKFAIMEYDGPIAIRYPKGAVYRGLREYRAEISYGKCEEIYAGNGIMLYAFGSMVETAETVHDKLAEVGISSTLVNARFAKPFDEEYLLAHMDAYEQIILLEEGIMTGGMGESIACFLREHGYQGKVHSISIRDTFVEHGSVSELKQMLGIDADSIFEYIRNL